MADLKVSHSDKHYFGGNREKAIQRDKEKCVKCGLTRKQHKRKYGRDITVDHIDGKGCRVPKAEKNNSLSNLQTLCSRCHTRKDSKNNKKTHCPKGHPYSGHNLLDKSTSVYQIRECRICMNNHNTRYRRSLGIYPKLRIQDEFSHIKEKWRRKWLRRKKIGMCQTCYEPVDFSVNKMLCKAHYDKSRLYHHKRRKRLRLEKRRG